MNAFDSIVNLTDHYKLLDSFGFFESSLLNCLIDSFVIGSREFCGPANTIPAQVRFRLCQPARMQKASKHPGCKYELRMINSKA